MTRKKKSRNVNENAAKRAPRTKQSERSVAGKKQNSGNKSGSRQAVANATSNAGNNAKKDPRVGSKKPVQLVMPTAAPAPIAAVRPVKQAPLTDEQKLAKLENDPRLNNLLDQLEDGKMLAAEDQQWLDVQLAELERLMEKLGIDDLAEADQVEFTDDDDLLAKFDAGEDLLKQYQQDDK